MYLQSENVKDACYQSDWVDFNLKVRKSLFIIMERSKRPVYLTAGGFANLSLDSYKSVCIIYRYDFLKIIIHTCCKSSYYKKKGIIYWV